MTNSSQSPSIGDFEAILSPRSKQMLTLAQEEAEKLGHHYIGTEHFLLGIARENDVFAAQLLNVSGASVEQLRIAVWAIVGENGHDQPSWPIEIDTSGDIVLELSAGEAIALRNQEIDPEHVLLAIVDEDEGIGVTILESLGVSVDLVRSLLIKHLTHQSS